MRNFTPGNGRTRLSVRVRRCEKFVILSEHAFVPFKGFAHTGQTLLRRRRFR